MILKIEKITSIGKFNDFKPSGDIAFKPLTVIYADNGCGKTTLTAILRSLALNEPHFIQKRLTHDSLLKQEAKIIARNICGDVTYSFKSSGWSNFNNNIEIFDIHFVNDNIYSGFDFSEDHKRQLHRFIIGAQGIELKNKIEKNKRDKSQLKSEILNNVEILQRKVGYGLNDNELPNFMKINKKQLTDIDSLISQANQDLNNARKAIEIQSYELLNTLPTLYFNIEFSNLKKDLEHTASTIQNIALENTFNDHCAELRNNSLNTPETWIELGYDYYTAKQASNDIKCPFCQQSISSNLDIIKAYTQQFNEEFKNFLTRLQNYLSVIEKISVQLSTNKIKAIDDNNSLKINLWNKCISEDHQIKRFQDLPSNDEFNNLLVQLCDIVRKKIQNPTVSIETLLVDEFSSFITNVNRSISIYNDKIELFNGEARRFKQSIPLVATAETRLNNYQRIKIRFQKEIEQLCEKLLTDKKILNDLDKEYKILVTTEEHEAKLFFEKYKDSINYYLKNIFRTPFQISEISHVSPKGKAKESKIAYDLTISGKVISFDTSKANSVKEALSEGDKSTIALSFFLSKFNVDSVINNKIIVFDDPLSSFDSGRRYSTIMLLRELKSKVEQIIVLSHNAHFLYDLYKDEVKSERKSLLIEEHIPTGSSSIIEANLETLIEPEYFSYIRELEGFHTDPKILNKDRTLELIRKTLESFIRFKFYRQTKNIPPDSRTFGKLVTELENQNILLRDEENKKDIFRKLKVLNAISCKPHHGEPEPDYASLGINPNTISIRELHGFVEDTLELIDAKI